MAYDGSFSWIDPDRFREGKLVEPNAEERFPEGAVGANRWEELTRIAGPSLREWKAPVETALEILVGLRSLRPEVPAGTRRLFISHRRADLEPARRIAEVAIRCGYQYWLDVEDPALAGLGKVSPPESRIDAVLVAAIIEIALLNSTHVIAAITPNSFPRPANGEPTQTGPSLWIPYEFGRVKAPTLASEQAASWVSRDVHGPLPEYLHLGRILADEDEIAQWLHGQVPGAPPSFRTGSPIWPTYLDPIISRTQALS